MYINLSLAFTISHINMQTLILQKQTIPCLFTDLHVKPPSCYASSLRDHSSQLLFCILLVGQYQFDVGVRKTIVEGCFDLR